MQRDIDKISDSESEILKVLWASDVPMTERQIRDALAIDFDWRKTTIQTLIKRLIEKGALVKEKRDVYIYIPTFTQEEFEKARTVHFLNRVFSGNAKSLVTTMLNNDILSDKDMGDMKSYWKEWEERMRKNE